VGSTKTRRVICAISLPVLLLCSCDKGTDPEDDTLGDNWSLIESWPSSDINSIVWGDTLCVAVGNDGVVHSSIDGLQWIQQTPELLYTLNDVTWTGSEFVAVGSNATIGTSSDGITWLAQVTPAQGYLQSVAGSGTHILAAGYRGYLVSTTDGIDWIEHASGINITFEDILIDDTLWLACGDSGMTATSPDGFVWTRRAGSLSEECHLVSLAKTGTLYFALGVRETLAGIGKSFVYSSPDAQVWSLAASLDGVFLRSITWSGTELVAVGERSLTFGDIPESVVMTSPDGTTWQEEFCEAPGALTCVVSGPGFTAAAGVRGYIVTGTSPSNLEIDHSGATISGLVYDGSRFIGVTDCGTVVTSSNGSSWEERHSFAAQYFSKLVYSGGRYVALGGSNGEARSIYFSPNGVDWTQVWEPIGGEIFDLIRGGEQFVGVGEYGHIFLSEDGQHWDRITAAGAIDFRSVTWSGSRYLALGDSTAHKSSDGLSWSAHDIEAPEGSVIKQVIWAEGQYRAVGYRLPDSGDDHYCFFSSANGFEWTAKRLASDYIVPDDLAWTGARYVIYGRHGTLLISVNGEEWEILDTGTDAEFADIAISSRRLILAGADRTVLRSER